MALKSDRPIYLDLRRIRMPVAALVSILHRISGVILFISIPFMAYLFGLSLISSAGFERVLEIFQNGFVKVLMFIVLWALMQHFAAGIRFLLIDADVGVEIEKARHSAKIVNIIAIVVTLVIGALLL